MRVVIIEDEEILLKVLEEKFTQAGFDINIATDGEQAVPSIIKSKPDIIVLDLILPRKSGFEVLQELKNDQQLKKVPVVVLSNLGQEEDIKKALQMGAEDYIVKTQHPINEVIERVKSRVLRKSK